MDHIEITIRDFKSYIKRRDITSPTWFATEHNLLLHPDFFKVTGDEVKAFLWILGTAAHLNSATIRVYFDLCASQIRIPKNAVRSCIEKLSEKRWDVTDPSRARDGGVRDLTGNSESSYPTIQDSTEQNSSNAESGGARSALFADALPSKFQNGIKPETEDAWLAAYGDRQWIDLELKKAAAWISANPSRAPKSSFARFFTNWLARGWESHRKKMPRGPRPITYGPAKPLSDASEKGMRPVSEILGVSAIEALKKRKQQSDSLRGDDA